MKEALPFVGYGSRRKDGYVMQSGMHGFDGSCAPGSSDHHFSQETFSVGIFRWVPRADKTRCKPGPVLVRVRGRCSNADAVYDKAREIVALLDAGTYSGPKTVTVP